MSGEHLLLEIRQSWRVKVVGAKLDSFQDRLSDSEFDQLKTFVLNWVCAPEIESEPILAMNLVHSVGFLLSQRADQDLEVALSRLVLHPSPDIASLALSCQQSISMSPENWPEQLRKDVKHAMSLYTSGLSN